AKSDLAPAAAGTGAHRQAAAPGGRALAVRADPLAGPGALEGIPAPQAVADLRIAALHRRVEGIDVVNVAHRGSFITPGADSPGNGPAGPPGSGKSFANASYIAKCREFTTR